MIINVEITSAIQGEIEVAVFGQGCKHVIKETYSGVDVNEVTSSVQVDGNLDIGFVGVALDGSTPAFAIVIVIVALQE